MKPEVVRDDQWQGFVGVYVNDSLELGVRNWFESSNPQALAQIAERMLEAVRKEYWQAGEATVRQLVELYADLRERYQVVSTW
ncbi:cobaltochelatase subunit CobN [Candidatus Thiosymbion oneisti]|uniref:cobaltochelatase subunit CobN n=1 Tax=Candidatus Thiosymbion oneisti TaxID=589554 RepID=UPI000A73BBC2|nr:cobaltochelatase subunit CobN [Candidatus Thiosymbion oneisti]